MQRIEKILSLVVTNAFKEIYNSDINASLIQIQLTKKEFKGDFTFVVFPFLRFSKKSPELTAHDIGKYLVSNSVEVEKYNVIKGFLNLTLSVRYWSDFFKSVIKKETYGFCTNVEKQKKIVIEFSSPNTNKPLHLGHIRNNLLGWSVTKIAEANGHKVTKVNLVNDRGIHICKSMLAWKEIAGGKTPKTESKKGDHFVGEYYVAFDKKYKEQISDLVKDGISEDEARNKADWMMQAREMLKKWERGEKEIRSLWKTMNEWVYSGFNQTYKKLGVNFDKIYYESETYLRGKEIIQNALKLAKLDQKEDKTVYIDLTEDGFDEKVLLRSDGTALYMTQDIGTAIIRYEDYQFDESIYVVGNEQDYHFKVMKIILKKLDYTWAENITHLSYGMVELPHGKMKSREGIVVDADELIEEMIRTAEEKSNELGKLEDFTENEKIEIYRKIALGALKYFILKVDAKKNMTFNPEESIDFNGNTGPFIQYTYVRIKSMIQKAKDSGIEKINVFNELSLLDETELIVLKRLYDFEEVVKEAELRRNPSTIANFVYELAKEFNRFYHEIPPILKEKDENVQKFRLSLSGKVSEVIKSSLNLLGIEVPERM